MVVPLVGRSLAAVAGALLVLTAWASIIGTLMVPRAITSWLTRWTDRIVNGAFRLVTGVIDDHQLHDRPDDHRAADRLPADSVCGVQPEGNRGGAAERARAGVPSWGPELLARTH
jgi:hypothetical protein